VKTNQFIIPLPADPSRIKLAPQWFQKPDTNTFLALPKEGVAKKSRREQLLFLRSIAHLETKRSLSLDLPA
jgi:hypothetical protein